MISTLNGLIEINRDAQKGFLDAAERIAAPEIKAFCSEQSRSRAHYVGELQTLVLSLGDEPEKSGTVTGALRRGWMDLKAAFGGGDRAILNVIEAGEDHAIIEYDKALAKVLPSDVKGVVEHQCKSVKLTHDKIKALRDSVKK